MLPPDLEPMVSTRTPVSSVTSSGVAPAHATHARSTGTRLASAAVCLAGVALMLLLMANEQQLPHSVLIGMVGLALSIVGLTRFLGLVRPAAADTPSLFQSLLAPAPHEPAWASLRSTLPVAAALSVASVLLLAWSPALREVGIPVTIASVLLVLGVSAVRRPALAVFVVGSLLYLPLLGSFGLWDPWETHYGEVAREILSRDDWISLWWAQDRWFWSKPIFIFWAEALVWNVLGVHHKPDQFPQYVEWALRLPTYLVAMSALLAVYGATTRMHSRRAGLLASLALMTMPLFFFMAHQAITDMPFVGFMTVAVCLLLIAFNTDTEAPEPQWRIGRYSVTLRALLVAAIVAVGLPQALYLIARNVTFVDYHLFAWHLDSFWQGSAGNEGVPGNVHPGAARPYAQALYLQPFAQGLGWLAGLGVLIWRATRLQSRQGLIMLGFYLSCALAFMAKGIPGFALPALVAALLLITSGGWRLLWEGRLHVAQGILLIAVIGLPWFVAMYLRHGPPFTDRILIHDHVNRLAQGVHGDKGAVDYFLRQLGYGAFPWIGLLPAAVASWLRPTPVGTPNAAMDRRHHSRQTVILWCVAAFTLFSAMITKFHHYIFPVLPPAAILVGITLDRMLGGSDAGVHADSVGAQRSRAAVFLLSGMGACMFTLGVAGGFGDVRGIVPSAVNTSSDPDWVLRHGWPALVAMTVALGGLGMMALAWRFDTWTRLRLPTRGVTQHGRYTGLSDPAALACLGGAVMCAFIGRDLAWAIDGNPAGYQRLIHLFVYNYKRPWPAQFDYRPILSGFACGITFVFALGVFKHLRRIALGGLCALALAFSVFCLNVYMIDLTPHWSQRGLFDRYYQERRGPEEPIVAWQMNWKGENLYTGNRVAVFAKLDNKEVTAWMEKNAGKRAFFVLEHTRLKNFERLVKSRQLRQVTTKEDNNKFLLMEVQL